MIARDYHDEIRAERDRLRAEESRLRGICAEWLKRAESAERKLAMAREALNLLPKARIMNGDKYAGWRLSGDGSVNEAHAAIVKALAAISDD
jgi:hypothetical protein